MSGFILLVYTPVDSTTTGFMLALDPKSIHAPTLLKQKSTRSQYATYTGIIIDLTTGYIGIYVLGRVIQVLSVHPCQA